MVAPHAIAKHGLDFVVPIPCIVRANYATFLIDIAKVKQHLGTCISNNFNLIFIYYI